MQLDEPALLAVLDVLAENARAPQCLGVRSAGQPDPVDDAALARPVRPDQHVEVRPGSEGQVVVGPKRG